MPKPLTQQLNTSQNGSSVATFDDEENVIITVLIALHDHVLANTASTGPTMDAKNRVWDLIRERLCNRNGAIQRTDEQVRNRWRSLRSSYAFKQDKARHLAEMFYKRLGSDHKIRLEDISVPGIKFPQWLQNMIKNDSNFKPGAGGKPVVVKKREPQRSLSIGKNTDEPVNKKRRTLPPTKTEPGLVDQEAETFVFKKIVFPIEDEEPEQEKPSNSTPPSSVHEELNSVTESGANTPSVNEDVYETEAEANYRRKEELHQAQLALLNAKRREVDMRMKLTHLQIQAFLRQNGALFDFSVEESNGEEIAEKEVDKSQMFNKENDDVGEAEVPNVSASEPIDTATDGGQEG